METNGTPQQEQQEPRFELEQSDIYGQYILTAPLDVLSVLRSLVKRGCMATVYFNGGRSFFLTCVLGISDDRKEVLLDASSDAAINGEAVKANRLIATTTLDNVKVQFLLRSLRQTAHEGRPAFFAPVPDSLLRLQRREYFRLETPLAQPVHCRVPIQAGDGTAHQLNLTVLDISGGGVSVMVPPGMEDYFDPDSQYADCRLEIPGEGVISATLCVRSAFRVLPRNGHSYLRAGCEFINLPGTRLTLIQRYITRIERDRKARESGLL